MSLIRKGGGQNYVICTVLKKFLNCFWKLNPKHFTSLLTQAIKTQLPLHLRNITLLNHELKLVYPLIWFYHFR